MDKLVILAGGISSRMKKSIKSETSCDEKLLNEADNKSKSMIGLGESNRPFLDYLLFNANSVGIKDVVIVISEKDNSIKEYYGYSKNNRFLNLSISYAIQKIPKGRIKPIGTADALYSALESRKDWNGSSFIVCNSDNLYSIEAFNELVNTKYLNALIDYNRDGFEFNKDRVEKFAITMKNNENYLTNIIEKPKNDLIENVLRNDGYIGVSMNIFKFNYDMIYPFLQNCPFNEIRKEKELPTAIKMMIDQNINSLYAIPFKEHVPDLTDKNDILYVKSYILNNKEKYCFEEN